MKARKITTTNYFETIEEVGFENLPLVLKQSHMVIMTKTDNGSDWSKYQSDADLKRMIVLAFEKLSEFISATASSELSGAKEEGMDFMKAILKSLAADVLASFIVKGYSYKDLLKANETFHAEKCTGKLQSGSIIINSVENQKTYHKFPVKEIYELTLRFHDFSKVKNNSASKTMKKSFSSITTEIDFIQRFLKFHDKILYKNTFGIFIDDLQKAIAEKKITKKSPVAKEIMEMQQACLQAFNTMRNAKHFVLTSATIKRLKAIIEKYDNSHDDIDESYVKTKKKSIALSGIDSPSPQVNIMSSTDFANLQFNTLGFKDKWLEFIGDPTPGFTAMVFGMPKMGKSYLCVDFAGYLARNHGRVLYVAKEEKLDKTLQDKLKDKNVAHENLFVSDALPLDLSNFDFVFLDSVNKIGLTPKNLEKLKADNKGKSFIYVFQATKGGQFKGNNEFQHDVDIVIEVPEQGKAIQFGRFNQGGKMDIFPNKEKSILPAEEGTSILAGIDDAEGKTKRYSKHPEIPDISEPYFYDFSKKGWDGISKEIRQKILKGVPNANKYLEYEWKDLKPELKQKILDFHFGWRVKPKVDPKAKAVEKKPKIQKTKEHDWTEPAHLNPSDHWTLKQIKKHYENGDMEFAMNTARNADTIIREEIPPDIWVAMGGGLTPTGQEKLKKILAERAKKK